MLTQMVVKTQAHKTLARLGVLDTVKNTPIDPRTPMSRPCPTCQTEIPDFAMSCPSCRAPVDMPVPPVLSGAVLPPENRRVTGEKPDNNLVLAIISTLCCCVPLGIVSIVYAAQVDNKWTAGDLIGAQESSDKAKMWGYVSIGTGLIGSALYVLLLSMGYVER